MAAGAAQGCPDAGMRMDMKPENADQNSLKTVLWLRSVQINEIFTIFLSDLDAPNYFFCIFVHRMGRIAPIIRSDALLTLAFIFTGGHLCTVVHAETNNESDKIIINVNKN